VDNEDIQGFALLRTPVEKNGAEYRQNGWEGETFESENAESLFWTVPLFLGGQKVKMKNFKFLIFNYELWRISTKWKFRKFKTQNSTFKIDFKGVG
jgi:hypothetical protein